MHLIIHAKYYLAATKAAMIPCFGLGKYIHFVLEYGRKTFSDR